jgi:general stress protein CsbA
MEPAMNDEEMKRLWQNQPLPEPPKDVATLVAMAGQEHRKFQRTIFWRDFREVGVALALIPVFLAFAQRKDALWTSYLIVLALVFVAGFMVIDRLRWRKAAAGPGETIADTIAAALAEVEHQIWLLRNVLWWYIGPLMGALIIDTAHLMLRRERNPSGFIGPIAVFFLVGVILWWANQRAVKRCLEPRRRELQKLLEAVR